MQHTIVRERIRPKRIRKISSKPRGVRPGPTLRTCPNCGKQHVSETRDSCSNVCRYAVLSRSQKKNRKPAIYNDFLPPDADENLSGTWVPSPWEIAQGCAEALHNRRELQDVLDQL